MTNHAHDTLFIDGGLGRELGPGTVAAYQNLKTVYA
jgi:hypothetical protein